MLYIAWDGLVVKTNKVFFHSLLSLWELWVWALWWGGVWAAQQVWSSPPQAPYVTWLGPTQRVHSACVAVGTRAISRASARGLALMAEVRCWPCAEMCSNDLLHLTLIPDQLKMRFPCGGLLVLTLLWTLSLGMIKGNMLGDWVKLVWTAAAPFILSYEGLKHLIEGLIHL